MWRLPAGPTWASGLAACAGLRLVGPDALIEGVAPLEQATAGALCWSKRAIPTEAGLLVCPSARPDGGAALIAEDPRAAFASLLRALAPPEAEASVHPSAQVHPSAKLGPGVRLGPGVVVAEGSEIGEGSVLHANVVVEAGVVIGRDCEVFAGAVLGGPGFGFGLEGGRLQRVPQVGGLRIGDRVEIGANAVIDRGALGDTVIEDDVKIDNLVQIAHNVRLGRGAVLAAQVGVAGSSQVGAGAQLGGQVGVSDHVVIGPGARVGAQAGVIGRVEAGEAVWGTPAMPRRLALRVAAALRRLPDLVGR